MHVFHPLMLCNLIGLFQQRQVVMVPTAGTYVSQGFIFLCMSEKGYHTYRVKQWEYHCVQGAQNTNDMLRGILRRQKKHITKEY